MSIVTLIPALICIVVLLRGSASKAFLNVYLPVFMLCPTYYCWKVASLPPIDASEAVLLPLSIAILVKHYDRWRFSSTDLWMSLFIISSAYSDLIHQKQTAFFFELFANFLWVGVPYMAGKLLIEQENARVATTRRFLMWLFFVCVLSTYEYRMGSNLFINFWRPFFPGELFAWKTQIRWGFGRVSGPFAQSELAGLILLSGFVLTLWLGYSKQWEPKFSRAPWLPFRKSTLMALAIGVSLLMTQARGPWLGALIALPIAFIGRAKNIRRTAMIVVTCMLILGTIGSVLLKQYATYPYPDTTEQQTAQYRQQLLDNYIPIAQQGGPWGWGQDFPRAIGQDSIDNEYLFIALTQGWIGLGTFCLISIETVIKLILAIHVARNREDTYFAFSLTGIFVGILFTIFTVYLGNQPYQLFFLLVGWSQSLVLRETEPRTEQEKPAPAFGFRQIFT